MRFPELVRKFRLGTRFRPLVPTVWLALTLSPWEGERSDQGERARNGHRQSYAVERLWVYRRRQRAFLAPAHCGGVKGHQGSGEAKR